MTSSEQQSVNKIMLVVVREEYRKQLVNSLLAANFRVTEFSSTGGFFRRGNTTLMIGLIADRMDEALGIVRRDCASAADDDEHAATIFVLPAQQITEF